MRILELFCGIGGCAAAIGQRAEVVAAIDINQRALMVYGQNFAHPVMGKSLESLSRTTFERFEADLWWMSPPCQPFTSRGNRRDMLDPRTAPLLHVLSHVESIGPRYVGLENVPGFVGSATHARVCETLGAAGYLIQDHFQLPADLPPRRLWPLVGNSLSVACLQHVLAPVIS